MASYVQRDLSSVLGTALRMTPLSADTQAHMVKVYQTLCTCIAAAAVGAGVQMWTGLYGGAFLLSFVMLGVLYYFLSLPQYSPRRVQALHAIAFLQGVITGPLLSYGIVEVDARVPVVAFGATAMVFFGLSVSAMFSRRRSFILLGGVLSSFVSILLLASVVSLFWPTYAGFALQLYGGLALFCGYVLYDTQLIIARAELGDKDYVHHALDLFLDLAAIFRRILIIMLKNQQSRRRTGRKNGEDED